MAELSTAKKELEDISGGSSNFYFEFRENLLALKTKRECVKLCIRQYLIENSFCNDNTIHTPVGFSFEMEIARLNLRFFRRLYPDNDFVIENRAMIRLQSAK